jgi:biopolymer transport protein ExbB
MTVILNTVRDFLVMGGFVMWPLLIGTLVLWYALGYRASLLRRGSSRSVRVLFERYRDGRQRPPAGVVDTAVVRGLAVVRMNPKDLRRALDDAFAGTESSIKRGRMLVLSIVAAAPLAGLLGTVTGMIETFDSLADMSMFSQSGGIAGGIAQALFTTQMGLSIAVPGLIVGRLLDQRQGMIERELAQLKDILCTESFAGEQRRGLGAS